MKFKTKLMLADSQVKFIIGINPGKQRLNCKTNFVWEGNRSGDFVHDIARESSEHVFLTNVCNYQVMSRSNIKEGLEDLEKEIRLRKPRTIICLGTVACKLVKCLLREKNLEVVYFIEMLHPSFVLRFNRDVLGYKKKLLNALRC